MNTNKKKCTRIFIIQLNYGSYHRLQLNIILFTMYFWNKVDSHKGRTSITQNIGSENALWICSNQFRPRHMKRKFSGK